MIILIGSKLKEIRKEFGYTQKQVEALTGIDRSNYSRLESKNTRITLGTLLVLSALFGHPSDFCEIEDGTVVAWEAVIRNLATLYKKERGLESLLKEIS